MNQNKQISINYQMISFLQFTFSILVIALHCTRIFNNDILHFIQKSFFSRMAVPYFIVSSSFFITLKRQDNPNYLQKYRLKTMKTYLFWSALFTPYAYHYFQSTTISSSYLFIGLIFAIFYIGTCYHLWYIPALLFALFITDKLNQLLGWTTTFIVCLMLYLIGTIETYSLFIKDTPLFSIYTNYKQVLFTTRNGLFFTPIFILIGCLIYIHFHKMTKINAAWLLLVTSSLFTLEATFIFFNQGDDKNFYLALIPFTFSLFYWSITTNFFNSKDFSILKEMSVLFFFLHPVFIELFPFLFKNITFKSNQLGITKFIFTVTCCLIFYLILNLHKVLLIIQKRRMLE